MRHFMRHSTILCVTQPSYASLNHLRQDMDFINNFDTIWSSKWLWSIIFSSESDYLDDKTFQHMHVTCLKDDISIGPQGLVCICAHPIYGFAGLAVLHLSNPADKWYQRFLWSVAGFLPKKSWIFQLQSSAFAVRWFFHICQSLLFSSLLINRNSFVQPIFTQPFLQCDEWWWKEIFGDGWWWIKGWSIARFLPKRNCIYQLQSSAFADRWYPHLSEFVVFFTAHQSEFICPTHFHSAFLVKHVLGV